MEKEASKWKKLDKFQLKEILVYDSDENDVSKDERKLSDPYDESFIKENLLDNFLEDELEMEELKKIKKDYIKDQVNSLSKEEGEIILENIKSKYVCIFI